MNVLLSLVIQQVDKDLKFSKEKAINERCYKVRVYTCFMIDRNNIFKVLNMNHFVLVKYDDMKVTSIKIWNSKDGLLVMILYVFDANKSSIELNVL